ncbi:MAG: AAA family ATPase [Bdellovibrionota bacterium]
MQSNGAIIKKLPISAKKNLTLEATDLYRSVNPDDLKFEDTADIKPLEGTIGQARAIDTIQMGAKFSSPDFHIYVAGMTGSGRETTVRELVAKYAAELPTPPDFIYVHNFSSPDHPVAIELPAGIGTNFAREMDDFSAFIRREIPKAFETENYEKKRRDTLSRIHHRRRKLLDELSIYAKERNVTIEVTPSGFISVPLIRGKPIPTEEFENLAPDDKDVIEKRTHEVQAIATTTLRQLRSLDKEEQEQIRQLDREIARFAIGGALDELRDEFKTYSAIGSYLDQVEEDLLENLAILRSQQQDDTDAADIMMAKTQKMAKQDHFNRYRVNVFVDNSQTKGAPLIFEQNPTYYNLFGRISFRSTFGALVTDLLEIECGSVQRANGGFLVIDALEVLRNPFSWEALKRVLLSKKVQIENLGEQFTLFPVATLRPQGIKMGLKVILIGTPWIYRLLYQMDPEFPTLFKLRADFGPEMDWDSGNIMSYAAFISRCVREKSLLNFDKEAVSRIIEHGARLSSNQRKLSTHLSKIADLAAEASHWARETGHTLVTGADVDFAIDKKIFRSNIVETKIHEWIADGTIMIDTDGAKVGQINGIAVIDIGDYMFGRPSRITASISIGRGTVRSIERETKLSGRIHSKGFLILSGYLRSTYAQEWPLSLGATITFEQSYDEVEGDSASSTELYALLSALSGIPILQGIAVTGSVNQHGEIQAVGGVNEKIEGFFSVCRENGLTGNQGVIIPRSNVPNLMLRKDVRNAVEAGQFSVCAVQTINEGIRLLTGVEPGERRPDGRFPVESLHGLVQEKLDSYARTLQIFQRLSKNAS